MQVEVAMVGGALNISAEQVLEYQAYGNLMERHGNEGLGAPHNLYRTADVDDTGRQDTWVAIVVETDQQWCALGDALGRPAWALDERLLTAEGRRHARDELDEHLSAWCLERGADEVVAGLWPRGVPVARVTPGNQSDGLEQHAARGFYEPLLHPVTGEQLHMRYPVSFDRGPRRHHRSPAPTLGQNNDEVLGELLGITDSERRSLEAAGVVGTRLVGHHRAR
jgi:crotonobetainyl-CoA:carnitine CoA-transferase CaiB-like acyl-CoA transferase